MAPPDRRPDHSAQPLWLGCLIAVAAGCVRTAPVPDPSGRAAPGSGVVIGHLDAARAVGPSEGATRPQQMRQTVAHEDGRRWSLPFVRPGLAEDFRAVLPAGAYTLVSGRATNGHTDGATRRADWQETGLHFEVTAGQTTCIGRLAVARKRRLIEVVLPGRGGSFHWTVDDHCADIGGRLQADHPSSAAPRTRLAEGPEPADRP